MDKRALSDVHLSLYSLEQFTCTKSSSNNERFDIAGFWSNLFLERATAHSLCSSIHDFTSSWWFPIQQSNWGLMRTIHVVARIPSLGECPSLVSPEPLKETLYSMIMRIRQNVKWIERYYWVNINVLCASNVILKRASSFDVISTSEV